MSAFQDSYLGQLRQAMGHRKLIIPSVRAVIRNDQGELLFIRRRDNGRWGLPAGSMELGESIEGALKREVKEETGLEVISATPFAIYSDPKFTFKNMYDDEYQLFEVVFRVDAWSGEVLQSTDETVEAKFISLENFPDAPPYTRETLADLEKFNGQLILK